MTVETVSGLHTETQDLVVAGSDSIVFDPFVTSTLVVPNLIFTEASSVVSRPAHVGIKHSIVVDFDYSREADFVGGPVDAAGDILHTDNGVWWRDASFALMYGRMPTARASCITEAAAGDAVLFLRNRVHGWLPGDTIVINPTAFGDYTPEVRTITKVLGRSVFLDRPLLFDKPNVWADDHYVYAEVEHIERNIEIRGGAKGGHPHVHNQSTAPSQFTGVCMEDVAPARDDLLGRYAFHVHHCGDAHRGRIWSHLVVNHSGQRGFVPHASNGITWPYAIAHDVRREAFWWDPSSKDEPTETNDNLWLYAVSVGVTGNHDGTASFELRNGTGNGAIGCLAVANICPGASSGFGWPTNAKGSWLFPDNVAHNCACHPIYFWENSTTEHLITNFLGYHCGKGILEGSYLNHADFEGFTLVGNAGSGITQTAVSDNRGALPLTYRDGYIDCAGRAPCAIGLAPPEIPTSDPRKPNAVHYDNVRMTGYTSYAIMFVVGAKTPNGPQAVFTGCSVDNLANLLWMPDGGDPETFVQWDDDVIVPRNDPRAGTLHPEWNAKVLAPSP